MKLQIKISIIALFGICFAACKKEEIKTTGIINESLFLKRDHQSLFIKVAGNIDAKKILLIIHGGPGGSGLDYRDSFFINQLEPQFAVAYLDQRFGGNSIGNGGSIDYTSFQTDIEQTIDLLQQLFGSDQKIYLMAHSWGGFIAPYFLGNSSHQSKVAGWIQVDGAHDYPLNDSLTEVMLANYADSQFIAQKNTEHWQKVKDYCQKHNYSDGYDITAQLNDFAHTSETLMDSVWAPNDKYWVWDEAYSAKSNKYNLFVSGILRVDEATYKTPSVDYLKKINTPVLMMWGKYDFVCPKELATHLQQNIASTDISVEMFDHSGHSPMANEPDKFAKIITQWIQNH